MQAPAKAAAIDKKVHVESDEDSVPEKQKLTTSESIFNRIRHDESLNVAIDDFTVVYNDRFLVRTLLGCLD